MDAPITTLLCVITTVVTVVAFQKPRVLDRLLFRPHDILVGHQYERLASSALIHANFGHLALNLIGLYCFGRNLETAHGAGFLLLIYGSSVVGGSLLSLWLHRHEEYSALGASGGVCGVLYAHIFIFPGSGVYLLFLPIAIPGWLFAIGYLLLSVAGIRRGSDGIGHDAHLGGAIVGLLVAAVCKPRIIVENPLLFGAVMLLTAGMAWYFARRPTLGNALSSKSHREEYLGSQRYRRYDEARERNKRRQEMDQLLDKVTARGIHSLSARERQRLEELSKQI